MKVHPNAFVGMADRSKISRRDSSLLEDLKTFTVLGQGAFGKVKLVNRKDSGEYYALKLQRKDT
ncbi:hypothetical protein ACHAXN_009887, partial [Cyclotella atomus]